MTDSVRLANPDARESDLQLDKYIGNWLRQAPDREKSRQKKNGRDAAPISEASNQQAGARRISENSENGGSVINNAARSDLSE